MLKRVLDFQSSFALLTSLDILVHGLSEENCWISPGKHAKQALITY